MKIFDCFPFFNELEILELRLMELYDVVDYFVIVEANKSHNGTTKEFVFEKNKDRFKQYLDKIIYVQVTDMPEYNPNDVFKLEYFQRNQIFRGLDGRAEPGDKILVSDCDEIPKVKTLMANLNHENPVVLRQTLFYYYVNNMVLGSWCGTVIADFSKVTKRIQSLRWLSIKWRYRKSIPEIIHDGGWHYSYLTGRDAEKIKEKVELFAEKNLIPIAGSIEDINHKIDNSLDLYGRDNKGRFKQKIIDISDNKPVNLDKFLEKYPEFIYKK